MDTVIRLLRAPFEMMRSADTADQLIGWLMLTVFVITAGVILHVVIRGLYDFLDSVSLETRHEDGVITRKEHRPGYTQTHLLYNPSLRMLLPTSHYVPPRWRVRATLRNGYEGWMKVSQEQYERTADLRKVRATYRVGRFSGQLYIDRLEIARA